MGIMKMKIKPPSHSSTVDETLCYVGRVDVEMPGGFVH